MARTASATGGFERIRLLEADPDLAASLPVSVRARASRELVAPVRRLAPGGWEPIRLQPRTGHFGFLLLGGLIARELTVARGRALELLGKGDLLRPWQEDAASFDESRWTVLQRTELAELEPSVARRICVHPVLVDALLGRELRRCRSLAATAAIQSITGLEGRLLALFWHLAESVGRREDGGVAVPLPLTHRQLAEVVGARRPSVTAALRRLSADERLIRTAEGWLLRGAPPGGSADRAT